MTREEKIARAVELRGQGAYCYEIALYLGVSQATVTRWTNPHSAEVNNRTSRAWKEANRERKRAYDRQYSRDHRVPCDNCGAPCSPDFGHCKGCKDATADVRRTLVEGMWAAGWKRREINEALGVARDSGYIFVRRAQNGWDLPHRRSPEALANIRAGNPHLRTG